MKYSGGLIVAAPRLYFVYMHEMVGKKPSVRKWRDANADLTNKEVVVPYVATGFVAESLVVLSAIQVRVLEA
jgi:hypothetical protein